MPTPPTLHHRLALLCGSALAALGTLLAAAPAQAADHVVIMAIGTYPSAPLAGVAHDSRSALQIAEKLGYDTSSPTILKNEQLSASAMREALRQLAERVKVNDRLFFYYSGHGTSSLSGNQCVSSLVSHDEQLISTAELKTHFDRMKGKVQEALIIMDACFSGGHSVLARSNPGHLRAKAWHPKADEVCDQPTNVAKAWQIPANTARGLGPVPENNFTFIAAASERQIALDDPGRGGLATTSLLQCTSDGLPSTGLATARQLAACAQLHINASVPDLNARHGTRWTPHTLEVAGNQDRPLPTIKTTQPPMPAASAQPPQAAITYRTAHDKPAKQVSAALRQIATSGTNGNWAFQVSPTASTIRLNEPIQRRVVRFPYTSSQPGYGYVLYVGTDGKDMKQLFPEPGENNFLPAQGEFPPLSIDPPAGDNTYLFLISQMPQDFSHIFEPPTQGRGHESDVEISAQAVAVQCALAPQRNSGRIQTGSPCKDERNSGRLQAVPVADGLQGYAAQMVVVSGR